MRASTTIRSFAVLAALHLGHSSEAHETPPLWGGLRPGPYSVGFRTTWERDPSRRYDIVFDDGTHYASGKSPRPILINVWYPARRDDRSAPMRHRDYLAIASDDPQLARYASKVVAYEREVVSKEMMGKKLDELSEEERKLLEGFWDTPTASRRGAVEANGKFPLIIYHAERAVLVRGQRSPVRVPGQPRLRCHRQHVHGRKGPFLQHRWTGGLGPRLPVPDRPRQPVAQC